MATYTAKRLKIIAIGASTRPSASSNAFTGPSRCSRMNHAVVRTRMDVQNGTSTSVSATCA